MPSFLIYGSGLIGCTIGGWLQHVGADVQFLGRQKRNTALTQNGLGLRTMDGATANIPPSDVQCLDKLRQATSYDMILLCTKSMDTGKAATDIAKHAIPSVPIISLQNGLGNVELLRTRLPDNPIVAGMVGFNAIEPQTCSLHISTEGGIHLDNADIATSLVSTLTKSPISVVQHDDMLAVQWGKLTLNLNNGINALSGLPLLEQMQDRNSRKLMALCIDEALAVAAASGISPAKFGKVNPKIVPTLLRLPTWLFTQLARQMMKIDPTAKSSMADDLARGRASEIDYLNGKVSELGLELAIPTPANTLITREVKRLFEQRGAQHPTAEELLKKLK